MFLRDNFQLSTGTKSKEERDKKSRRSLRVVLATGGLGCDGVYNPSCESSELALGSEKSSLSQTQDTSAHSHSSHG
jgi:hypothetical protein